MIKIANFCGGRGSNSIVWELVKFPHVKLTNIINAYDDGKSTGYIRKFFRMLGPSDIRKNQIVMMNDDDCGQSLKSFFSFRFPEDIDRSLGIKTLNQLISDENDLFKLSVLLNSVDERRKGRLITYLNSFLENVILYEKVYGEEFPFQDCSIANCIYAGAFEFHGRDFGLTVDQVGKLFNMRGETIANSNENRHLVAIRENGLIMNSEAEIVESRTNVRIHDIYIVERPLTKKEKKNLDALDLDEKVRYLEKFSSIPFANTRCIDAIREADIILYSPGTQHSSLYPTYMTKYIGQIVRENRDAMKVFIANIGEDYETPAYSASELVSGALQRLKSSDPQEHGGTSSYIHYVLANNKLGKKDHLSKYIKLDLESVEKLGVKCISGGFEDKTNWGKHDGKKLGESIFTLLNRFDKEKHVFEE